MRMNVDANRVIDFLGNQIKEMSRGLALRDSQLEILQNQISELNNKLNEQGGKGEDIGTVENSKV